MSPVLSVIGIVMISKVVTSKVIISIVAVSFKKDYLNVFLSYKICAVDILKLH